MATNGAKPAPIAPVKPQLINVAKATAPAPPTFQLSTFQTRQKWLKALFYGTHGAGKTELAGSCVDVDEMNDVFMISAEKGEMTIEETDRIKNKEKLFIAQCDNIAQIELMRQWLIAHCTFRDKNDEANLKMLEAKVGLINDGPAKRFKTVILDSLTEAQAFAMYAILGQTANMSLTADIPDTEWAHFNKVLNRIQILARAFRDLPMNVILLAQEDYKQDETKKFVFSPMLAGQMSKRICGFVDMVGYLKIIKAGGENSKDIRRLFVQPVGPFAAKNRMASYKEAYFDDPYMPNIVKSIGWGAVPSPEKLLDSTATT